MMETPYKSPSKVRRQSRGVGVGRLAKEMGASELYRGACCNEICGFVRRVTSDGIDARVNDFANRCILW